MTFEERLRYLDNRITAYWYMKTNHDIKHLQQERMFVRKLILLRDDRLRSRR